MLNKYMYFASVFENEGLGILPDFQHKKFDQIFSHSSTCIYFLSMLILQIIFRVWPIHQIFFGVWLIDHIFFFFFGKHKKLGPSLCTRQNSPPPLHTPPWHHQGTKMRSEMNPAFRDLCSGQKCDGRMIRRTDKGATICYFGEHKKS